MSSTAVPHLTREQIETFEQQGFLGPFPLLREEEAHVVARICRGLWGVVAWPPFATEDNDPLAGRPWFKSLHALSPEIHQLTSHPEIVGRVASLLGPDVMVWGTASLIKNAGQAHTWHVDVEHLEWEGVSAFVALRNVERDSALKFIAGSQRIDGVRPNDLFRQLEDRILAENTPTRPSDDVDPDFERLRQLDEEYDGAVLAEARRHDPSCELVQPQLSDGEFLLFHGKVWHGSRNTTRRIREAIVPQYARPDAHVKIPLDFYRPIPWLDARPPCALVSGADTSGTNRLASVPPRSVARALRALKAG